MGVQINNLDNIFSIFKFGSHILLSVRRTDQLTMVISVKKKYFWSYMVFGVGGGRGREGVLGVGLG